MLEDSISCSPGNDKKSFRSRRFHKNTKRKSQRLSSAPTASTSAEEIPSLEALYEGSTQNPTVTQYEHFNPFENEMILAAADMAIEPASSSKLNNLTSKGFVRLEELPAMAGIGDSFFPTVRTVPHAQRQPGTSASTPTIGPETQFGITESEFVRFCNEAEIDIESPSTTATKGSHGTKSIVDAILEDFCGSPYSESPPKLIADDSTPIFRFKSKSIRTYSRIRQRKLRRNIVTELENVHLPEDDGSASDSSGLSVQEDLSQSVVPQLDTVDLNNSIRVCENLLNLSSYFSQVTSHEKSSPPSEEKETNRLSAIVEDILKIKRKTSTINRSKSAEEFHGFSDGDSDLTEDTLKELLEDEDDVLQQINCDSLCYEQVVPKVSFEYNCSIIETVLESANAVIEESNKFISGYDLHTNAEESTSNIQLNCDKHEDVPQNLAQKSTLEDEQVFDDIDLWNDNECLLNYKTQTFNCNTAKPTGSERCLPSTDTTSHNIVFEKAGQLLKASTSTKQGLVEAVRNPVDAIFKKPMNISTSSAFLGFSTASRKPIEISDEAKCKAGLILTKFEQEENERRITATAVVPAIGGDIPEGSSIGNVREQHDISTIRNLMTEVVKNPFDVPFQGLTSADKKPIDKSPASSFLGFSTASRKPIAISNKAKQKADEILKKFEQEEREKLINMAEDIGDIPTSELAINAVNDPLETPFQGLSSANKKPVNSSFSSGFVGFSTASKKQIAISDVAKRRADEFLKNFEQAEKEERLQESIDLVTAGRKVGKFDEVSEEINQKAEELLMDIEFFEEAFEEELKTIERHPIEANVIQTRSVSSNKPIFDGFKTASKKSIQISENAKRHADQLLKKVEKEDLPQDFLQCIEADLNDVNPLNSADSSIGREEQVDGASKDPEAKIGNKYPHVNKANLCELNGLSFTSKKSVKFSEQSAEHVMLITNKELPYATKIELETGPAYAQLQAIKEDTDSSSQEYEMIETLKRKRNTFYTGELSSRRLSFSDRTPLNRIENAVLHTTSSLPLIKSTPKSAFISRKNLLSLSKRKKLNSPDRVGDASTGPKTPDKVQHPTIPHNTTNATPNLKEFFESVSTSTPRLIRNGESKVDIPLLKDPSIDTDFREINWEDTNNSGRVCRTSFVTDSNVTCCEVSPSPKQRIERLKMYGEPPPISPILMMSKCRTSGLRRGRSLMKP